MDPQNQVLKPYRLRTVNVAFQATVLALGALSVYPFLPAAQEVDLVPYIALMVVAIIGAGAFYKLPWNRLLDLKYGMWVFYAWSFLDIVLITLLVGVSGGARSEIYILYALTTVFLAASYPPKGQAGLIAVTFALYVAVVAVVGGQVSPASIFLRMATMGFLGFMGNFLSRELMQQMNAHVIAREESDRRALLMATITNAAQSMTLDTTRVLSEVVDVARQLGFDAASMCMVDEGGETFSIAHARDLPDEYVNKRHSTSAGMVGLVLEKQETVTVDEYDTHPAAIAEMKGRGFKGVAGSPIFSRGQLAGVLIAGRRREGAIPPSLSEALELLAAQAGTALDNAGRFEDQRLAASRLAELDRLKQDFMATISHELRTPLTIVKGMTKTLKKRWRSMDEPMVEEFLERIDQHSDYLDATITTLLDFSQLQSGKLEAHIQPTHVQSLVATVVTRLAALFVGRQVSTQIQSGSVVDADPRLLDVVLDNLLSNAAKHTPKGTRVSVSARSVGGQIEVEVCDDGPGIDPSEAPHLAKEFYRGGEVNTRPTRGTGIGLALTGEILELHGSKLMIERLEPHGSRFAFRLPLVTMQTDPYPRATNQSVT